MQRDGSTGHPAINTSAHFTDMGGNNPPTKRELHPGLHLAANTLTAFTGELGAGHCHIFTKRSDSGITQCAIQPFGERAWRKARISAIP